VVFTSGDPGTGIRDGFLLGGMWTGTEQSGQTLSTILMGWTGGGLDWTGRVSLRGKPCPVHFQSNGEGGWTSGRKCCPPLVHFVHQATTWWPGINSYPLPLSGLRIFPSLSKR